MDRNNKNQQDSHELNKTIEQYCEDIINGKTYNLNNLINLNVIKAVYSNNNTKWYISDSEQEYTSYKELRKGLTDYIFQLHNGELWEEKELLNWLGKFIENKKPIIILTNKPCLQVTLKLVHSILEQIKNTRLTISGTFNTSLNYEEHLQKYQWNTFENRLKELCNSLLYINEINIQFVTENKYVKEIIKEKNIKNVIIDAHPDNFTLSKLEEWRKYLEVNLFFTKYNLEPLILHSNEINSNNPFSGNNIHIDFNNRRLHFETNFNNDGWADCWIYRDHDF